MSKAIVFGKAGRGKTSVRTEDLVGMILRIKASKEDDQVRSGEVRDPGAPADDGIEVIL